MSQGPRCQEKGPYGQCELTSGHIGPHIATREIQWQWQVEAEPISVNVPVVQSGERCQQGHGVGFESQPRPRVAEVGGATPSGGSHYCKKANRSAVWWGYPLGCSESQCSECAIWEKTALTPKHFTSACNGYEGWSFYCCEEVPGPLAQSAEQPSHKGQVDGSIPSRPTEQDVDLLAELKASLKARHTFTAFRRCEICNVKWGWNDRGVLDITTCPECGRECPIERGYCY